MTTMLLFGLLLGCGEESAEKQVDRPTLVAEMADMELPELPADMAEAANVLLGRMGDAYRNAPAMTDRVTMLYTGENMIAPPPQIMNIQLGHGADAFLKMSWNEWICKDGYVYCTDERHKSRYLVTPALGNLYQTLQTTFGTAGGLPPHLALRYDVPRDELLKRLCLGILSKEPTISACRREIDAEGKPHDILTLTAVDGWVTIYVDPRTHLMMSARAQGDLMGGQTPHVLVDLEIEFTPRVRDELETPISFDPQGREAVNTIEALTAK